MREIIGAQGGNSKVKVEDIPIGGYREGVKAEKEGRVHHVDNKIISKIARAAGAPKSRGAGVLMHVRQGDKVKIGDVLFEVIAESETKLGIALDIARKTEAVEMDKVILTKYV